MQPAEPTHAPVAGDRSRDRRATDNVVALKRRVTVWRGISAGMTALAASLAVVLLQPAPQAPIPIPAAPMVAMVSDEGKTMTVVANWDPDDRQLVLAMAGDMPEDPGKAHELWVIPEGGTPRSLGTMADRPMSRMELADTLAELLRQGADHRHFGRAARRLADRRPDRPGDRLGNARKQLMRIHFGDYSVS